MDFDKPKVYGDTSITDGLVNIWNRNTKVQLRLDGWAGNKPYATDFHSSSNFAPAIPTCKQTTQQVKKYDFHMGKNSEAQLQGVWTSTISHLKKSSRKTLVVHNGCIDEK